MRPEERLVYVITDLPEPEPKREPKGVGFWEALRPSAVLALVAGPLLAVTSIPVGLLLGWSPFVLYCAAVVGWPVLVNLVDLAGARFGWPPLAWTAARILSARRTTSRTTKEDPSNG